MSPASFTRRAAVTGLAAFSLGSAAACGDSISPDDDATFTGRWAGESWSGDARAHFAPGGADGDTLYITGSHPVGALSLVEQYVAIRVGTTTPGTHTLGADAVRVVDLVGGDVVSSTYVGSRPGPGTIEITRYDDEAGIVEGKLSFEAQPSSAAAPYGPTARFENGRFRATIIRTR